MIQKTNLVSLLLLLLLLLFSCGKEDCLLDLTGTYTGTESCIGMNNNVTMIITESSSDNQVVFSVSGTSLTFVGTVSDNCSQITIASQNIFTNGLAGNIDGSFSVSNNNLTGNIAFSGNGLCSYNLTRQ